MRRYGFGSCGFRCELANWLRRLISVSDHVVLRQPFFASPTFHLCYTFCSQQQSMSTSYLGARENELRRKIADERKTRTEGKKKNDEKGNSRIARLRYDRDSEDSFKHVLVLVYEKLIIFHQSKVYSHTSERGSRMLLKNGRTSRLMRV